MDSRIRIQHELRTGRRLVGVWASTSMLVMLLVGGTLGRHLAVELVRLAGM